MKYGISNWKIEGGKICFKCGNKFYDKSSNNICSECLNSRNCLGNLKISKSFKQDKRRRGEI